MGRKIFSIGLVLALIISGAALYLALNRSQELKLSVDQGLESMNQEVQDLSQKVGPFITTGDPVGYVIQFENGTKFYFAGDTGLIADMKFVVGDYYKPDVAFLPIGNFYTMDSKAAAYAASLVNPTSFVIPNHYASFPMLEQDPANFFAELGKYNLRAAPLKFNIGEPQDVMGVSSLWLGHGDWFFETPEGTHILIDPEVEYNAKYPESYKDLAQFGHIDLILITHGHFDHMTVPDLKKWVQLYDPIIIAPFEAGVWLKDYLPTENIMAINKGCNIGKEEMVNMGMPEEKVGGMADIRIHMVPASHSSSATPEGLSPKY